MSVDGLKNWQVLDDLRSIKLPSKAREAVQAARAELQADGLSDSTGRVMRELHRRHARQVRELHTARLRGRESRGRERMGLTDAGRAEGPDLRHRASGCGPSGGRDGQRGPVVLSVAGRAAHASCRRRADHRQERARDHVDPVLGDSLRRKASLSRGDGLRDGAGEGRIAVRRSQTAGRKTSKITRVAFLS